jgi:hypothetical protein
MFKILTEYIGTVHMPTLPGLYEPTRQEDSGSEDDREIRRDRENRNQKR